MSHDPMYASLDTKTTNSQLCPQDVCSHEQHKLKCPSWAGVSSVLWSNLPCESSILNDTVPWTSLICIGFSVPEQVSLLHVFQLFSLPQLCFNPCTTVSLYRCHCVSLCSTQSVIWDTLLLTIICCRCLGVDIWVHTAPWNEESEVP